MAEYMTAVLSAESGDTDTIAEVICECKKMGIPVLPPDVNESFENFTVIKAGTGDLSRLTSQAAELARRQNRPHRPLARPVIPSLSRDRPNEDRSRLRASQ